MQFKILIIIVTYNAVKWMDKCFSGFKDMPSAWEVVAIDNNSTDGTIEKIKEKFRFVRILDMKMNLGFGRANNEGLKIALNEKFDYVFLLNQDAWISVEDIQKLAELQSKNPEYYIVSPMHFNGSGTNFDFNFYNYVNKNRSTLFFDLSRNSYNDLYEVKGINAAAWLLSRNCLGKIGGFSPSFFHYGEDDNYIDRVLFHKGKIAVSPLSVVYHDREQFAIKNKKTVFLSKARIRKCVYDMSRPEKKTKFDIIFKYIFACLLSLSFKELMNLGKIIKNKEKSRLIGKTFLE